MRFLVDECLSPDYVSRLAQRGYPDAIHPIHVGLLGAADHVIVARALSEDRIVVTANGADFKKLLACEPLHPGAFVIEGLEKEPAWRQVMLAIAFVELDSRPEDYMVNRVIEVSSAGGVVPHLLPPGSV